MQQMKMEPLTEKKISLVRNYFQTWEMGGLSESEIWFTYWRMRYHWMKIDKAEEYLEKKKEEKAEAYKWKIEQELKQHLREYSLENWWEIWKYSLVNLKEWEDGRTLEIGILWNYDTEKQKQRWVHTVEIEERRNPKFFQEIVQRYNLVIDYNQDETEKPF